MRIHAVVLTFTSHPDDTGHHPRHDTVAADVIAAVEQRGYEDVQILDHNVRQTNSADIELLT